MRYFFFNLPLFNLNTKAYEYFTHYFFPFFEWKNNYIFSSYMPLMICIVFSMNNTILNGRTNLLFIFKPYRHLGNFII